MQRVNDGTPRVWHCPRCGAIKTEGAVPETTEPWIVARAARVVALFATALPDHGNCRDADMALAALAECLPHGQATEENNDA